MNTIKPPALRPGDLIGLVSPAGPVHPIGSVTPLHLERAIQILESLDYKVVLGSNATAVRGYLAGSDAQRACDINELFSERSVKAIFCIHGGYGSMRLLNMLDYNNIARNPKPFVGYSDITCLLIAIHQLTGLITFHGPLIGRDMSQSDNFNLLNLLDVLAGSTTTLYAADCVPKRLPDLPTPCTVVPGVASGQLIGGNLSLICSTLGTPYEIETKGKLLFVEEINEEPYRVDRMLTQLRLAGKLQDAEGIILGEFVNCSPLDPAKPSLELDEVIEDIIKPLGKPTVAGFPCGHGPKKLTLPIGVHATLDANTCVLTLNETAVAPSRSIVNGTACLQSCGP